MDIFYPIQIFADIVTYNWLSITDYYWGNAINFFIYDLVNNKITYESNISKGSVSWKSGYEIRLEEIPGTIQKNMTSTNVYILNVKTNSKIKLNGEEK